MRINYLKSENYTSYGAKKRRIQAVVIHYTGMRTLQSAVERLLYSKYKVSSHYVISRNGKILQLVKDNNIALHAGISNWEQYVKSDPRFKRPAELYSLCGNPKKAETVLGWKRKTDFDDLVKMMVEADIKRYGGDRQISTTDIDWTLQTR